MPAIGGDIIELTCNHPTKGSVTIYPKAGEDSTLILGGFRVEDEDTGVDGSGRNIKKMTRKRWSADIVCAWDNNLAKELEAVIGMAESPEDGEWTITHVSGAVYAGTGCPVGDLEGAMNAATFKLKIAGGGKLVKIL